MALWWLYDVYVFSVVVRPENLTFKIKIGLQGHGQLPPKTIGILTKLFSTSGPNLVILAWMVMRYGADKLKCGKFWLLS